MNNFSEIGKKLRLLRKENKQTLANVSDRLGISVSFLSDMELGRTQPSLATVNQLANFYGVDALLILQKTFAPDEAVQCGNCDYWRPIKDDVIQECAWCGEKAYRLPRSDAVPVVLDDGSVWTRKPIYRKPR
jgi:transcriptional regulator with XRE-family HTH domain